MSAIGTAASSTTSIRCAADSFSPTVFLLPCQPWILPFHGVYLLHSAFLEKSGRALRLSKQFDRLPGGPGPPGYAAWFLTKPVAIPPVSRPGGRGSWYKNQAHVPLSVPKAFGTLPGGPGPPGYAAWFLTKPAAIPPVSRPGGRGSWYKNQAHVLIFMIIILILLVCQNQFFL